MNERILELWRFSVLNNTKTPMNWQNAADEFFLLITEELVKLINAQTLQRPVDDFEEGYNHGLYLAIDLIKEYSGVE